MRGSRGSYCSHLTPHLLKRQNQQTNRDLILRERLAFLTVRARLVLGTTARNFFEVHSAILLLVSTFLFDTSTMLLFLQVPLVLLAFTPLVFLSTTIFLFLRSKSSFRLFDARALVGFATLFIFDPLPLHLNFA